MSLETVHPRACGELFSPRFANWAVSGSSPRMRGTPLPPCSGLESRRFIPAHAGNSKYRWRWVETLPVHPRACGELREHVFGHEPFIGSSPRMRETRYRSQEQRNHRRFIPAHAGNSVRVSGLVGVLDGSSPRMRGTRASRHSNLASGRFIPAHAGNSELVELAKLPNDGSSPRMRGTPHLDGSMPAGLRFIPAHAGNSSARRT